MKLAPRSLVMSMIDLFIMMMSLLPYKENHTDAHFFILTAPTLYIKLYNVRFHNATRMRLKLPLLL